MASMLLRSSLKILCVGAIAMALTGPASAVTYSFNKFLSGGGGGTDPKKQKLAQQSGAYICVDVSQNPESPENSVRFFIWSLIPQPNSRVGTIVFDTGRHAGLLSNISVLMSPLNVTAQVVPSAPHPFLRSLTPEFAIGMSYSKQRAPGEHSAAGLGPGDSIVLSATLGPGKTFANLVSALNEGINPATAATGLRLGVIGAYLLGGPPPGVGTIHDDGGFAISAASPQCRRR